MDAEEEWTVHAAGNCPVAPSTKIVVRYRNGALSLEIEAGHRRWEPWPNDIGESDWDIVAWKKT